MSSPIYEPYFDPINDSPSEIYIDPYDVYYLNIWKDKEGKFHRDGDLPALVSTNFCAYFQHGKYHRDGDLPAVVYLAENSFHPTISYYKIGQFHRDMLFGPAVIYPANTHALHLASKYKYGSQEYWNDGKRIKTSGLLPGEYEKLWEQAILSLKPGFKPKGSIQSNHINIYDNLEI
jgi:hypothetical protein